MFVAQGAQAIQEATLSGMWHAAYTGAILALSTALIYVIYWLRVTQDEYKEDLKKFIGKQSHEYQEMVAQTTAAVNTNTEVLRVVASGQQSTDNSVHQLERTILTQLRALRAEVMGHVLGDDGHVFRTVTENYPSSAILIFEIQETASGEHEYEYIYANGEALKWAGYDGINMEGRKLREVLTPEEVKTVLPFYKSAARGRSKEMIHVGENGRQYLTKAVPVKNHSAGDLGIMIILDLDGILEHAATLM